jgi:DNA-binding HxlR family transcriptional regulator
VTMTLLTRLELDILRALRQGPRTVVQLSRDSKLGSAALGAGLNTLERDGLVSGIVGAANRTSYSLTDNGRVALSEA